MERPDLLQPASQLDIYLHDIALSLRALVDLVTAATIPAVTPQPDALDLREPAPAAQPKRGKGAA